MNRKKVVVIILFLLTIVLGVGAVFIGIRLQQQTTAPVKTNALNIGDGKIVNMSGHAVDANGIIGTSNNGRCNSPDGVNGSCDDNIPGLQPGQTYLHVYYCNFNNDIQCAGGRDFAQGAYGSSDNTTLTMSNLLGIHSDACMIQVDVWRDVGAGAILEDFMVWRANTCGATATNPPPDTTQPPPNTTQPPPNTTQPPPNTTQPPVTTAVPTTPVPTTPVPTTPVVTTVVPTTPVGTTLVPTSGVPTDTPTGTITPTVPLPQTALISDEADRLIIGAILVLAGFWIYALDGHRILGNLFWGGINNTFDKEFFKENQDKKFIKEIFKKNKKKDN
jgi:hypothetical protein